MLENIAFLPTKEKKSLDYQHCKWGEGRPCSLSQPFCPGIWSTICNRFGRYLLSTKRCWKIKKEYFLLNWASGANLRVKKKRTLNWRPFWNKVYPAVSNWFRRPCFTWTYIWFCSCEVRHLNRAWEIRSFQACQSPDTLHLNPSTQ